MAKLLLVPLLFHCVSAASGRQALPKDSNIIFNTHSQKSLSHTKWGFFTYSNTGPIQRFGSHHTSGITTKPLLKDFDYSPSVVSPLSLTDQRNISNAKQLQQSTSGYYSGYLKRTDIGCSLWYLYPLLWTTGTNAFIRRSYLWPLSAQLHQSDRTTTERES